MRGDRIAFSHLLPVVDLALLVVLVFVPITLMSIRLYKASAGSNQVHVHTDQLDMNLPRDQIVPWAIRAETMTRFQTIKEVNLPGMIFDILISLPTSWPSTWHPAALLPESWDALIYPFFCLPFWWLVGCGLDGIVSNERLHWSLLLVGTLLSGICLSLALGFRFGMSAADRVGMDWFIRGFIGWTIAFAVLPIAWITQSIRQHGHNIRHRPPPPSSASWH
jgi:hypothetical protein